MRWMIGTAMMAALVSPMPLAAQAMRKPVPAAPAKTDLPAVRALVDMYVAEKRTPGIAVAVGHDDGPPLLLAKGRIGLAPDAAAATPDTLWRV